MAISMAAQHGIDAPNPRAAARSIPLPARMMRIPFLLVKPPVPPFSLTEEHFADGAEGLCKKYALNIVDSLIALAPQVC
jgi:hypothetical protein